VATTDTIPISLSKPLRVGELAKRTGKTVRALHLYEELGLLSPLSRSKGGFRLYSATAVARVAWISKLQDAGFSLHQLQELRGVVEDANIASLGMNKLREVFTERLRQTREQLGKLRELERELAASLAYLDGCKTCEDQHPAEACGGCNHHGHDGVQQPLLVAGIHKG
jgi:MerR family transcriptional regulator, copper efflux regulator